MNGLSCGMRRHARLLALLLCSLNGLWGCVLQAEEIDRAKALKVECVYMYNFAKFVQWPAEAFAEVNSPLRIGILNNREMLEITRELLGSKTAQNRSLEFLHFDRYDESSKTSLAKCHIVFLSSKDLAENRQVCIDLQSSGVLTVSDESKFATNGGMIEFFLNDSKIALRINHEVVQAARLKISSQILRLAEIVKTLKE
jgi:hypothetical protein